MEQIKINVDEDGNVTRVCIPKEIKSNLSMYIKGYIDALDDLQIYNNKQINLGRGIAKSFVENHWKIKNHMGFYRMVMQELEN